MKFLVYKKGQLSKDFNLAGSYLFGPDRTPLRSAGKIEFSDGVITCESSSVDSAGLNVMWEAEGFGEVMLPTTRLRRRPEPYLLNLELARSRLMQITIKREDWSFFDESSKLGKVVDELKHLFIKAVQNISDPAKSSLIADECLEKALEFSEKLAQKHAETFLAAKKKNRIFGRHTLGCCLEPHRLDDEQYCKRLFDMFGYVTIPVNWREIETEKGEYNFEKFDEVIDALGSRKLLINAGPLLRFEPEFLPQWLLDSSPAFEEVRDAAFEFVTQIVTRYSRYVHLWNVISGMNACNHLGFNFEQILEMTRTACLASRGADTRSKKIVEILYPWGEYYGSLPNTVPPLVYVDMVVQSGITFDALGVQVKFGRDTDGMRLRDMLQISSRLDCFTPLTKPLHITSVEVPEKTVDACAGYRTQPWDGAVQSQWIEQFYKVALGKSFVNTVTYGHLADNGVTDIPGSGLLAGSLEPKKAFISIGKLQKYILGK